MTESADDRRKEASEPPEMPEIEPGKSDRMTFKDWWTVVLSTLAFVLSAFGFYLSNVREYDDFRVLLSGIIPSQPAPGFPGGFTTTPLLTASFINAGSRAIAVQDIAIEVSQRGPPTGDLATDCFSPPNSADSDRSDEFEIDVEPFVVKPQDIAIRPLRKFRDRGYGDHAPDGTPIIPLRQPGAATRHLVVCMTPRFVAPDKSVLIHVKQLVAEEWPASQSIAPARTDGYRFLNEQPTVLLKEGSKFSLW